MHVELDKADLRILEVLQQHGNLSAAEVAEKVDMTTSTCWRRITRLEEAGVIKSRVTLLDREKVGLNVTVFSRVKLSAHGRDSLGKFEQAVREHPEVLECYTLMGDTDFLRASWCATSRRTRRSSSITSRGCRALSPFTRLLRFRLSRRRRLLPLSRR